jgi:hypothetical protein
MKRKDLIKKLEELKTLIKPDPSSIYVKFLKPDDHETITE